MRDDIFAVRLNQRYDMKKTEALEKQVGGNHYKKFKIQPIEFIQANNLTFEQGNIIKYICRYDFKDGIKDLDKAIHYIELIKDNLLKQQQKDKEFKETAEELELKFRKNYEKSNECCGNCKDKK